MKINYTWLQEYIQEPLPKPDVLAEKIIFNAFEVESIEQAGDDTIFDIKVLPDRAHDCLSHYGIAREISGLLGLTLKPFEFKTHTSVPSDIKVSIQTDACRRYIARKIFDVHVRPSPEWLQKRLTSIGQRSINNVVDATNYVMFTLGQPIHAFDYDKLASGHLIVRNAQPDEPMTTLDGKILAFDESMMVIADERHVLALAGIKGGTIAEVDESTKNIVIEVANFDPKSVRKTAKLVGIQNDSSKRFENEITPYFAETAMHMVTDLLVDLAGGQPEDPVDEFTTIPQESTVEFTRDYINHILGTDLATLDIQSILGNYNYAYTENNGVFNLVVPRQRLDITGPHDMAEEIGRAYGYEKIKAILPKFKQPIHHSDTYVKIDAVKNDLVSKGYSEIMNYAFRKNGDYEVVRGPVGKSALRKNLVDGIKESLEMNKYNKDVLGLDEIKIFEIGSVFPKSGEEIHVAYTDTSGVKEMKLEEYQVEHNNPLLSIKQGSKFNMWSLFPYITRDIAVWVHSEKDQRALLQIIKENGTELLQGEPRLFDQFSKEGKTSYGYRMIFQSYERTLTEDEISKIMENMYEEVKARGWEVR